MKNGHYSGKEFVVPSPAKGVGNWPKTYLLVEISHDKEIREITDLVAGRLYTLDQVRDVAARVVSKDAGWAAIEHDRRQRPMIAGV
jgi:hypothetical protein